MRPGTLSECVDENKEGPVYVRRPPIEHCSFAKLSRLYPGWDLLVLGVAGTRRRPCFPPNCQRSSLGDLVWAHLFFCLFALRRCKFVTPSSGQFQPHIGLNQIMRNIVAF